MFLQPVAHIADGLDQTAVGAQLLAQRAENYKSDVESLTSTAPLELADNGDHFSYPGVIDGERDELPL